eukprot:1850217-Amphidinium_carterae.1
MEPIILLHPQPRSHGKLTWKASSSILVPGIVYFQPSTRYSAVYYALNHMERLSSSDWSTLADCGFNPGMTSSQVISKVKAAFSEITDHDAYVEVLHQIDDLMWSYSLPCDPGSCHDHYQHVDLFVGDHVHCQLME